MSWEVIIVDNASTDATTSCAESLWPCDSPIPFRVVQEPQAGLCHARCRGFREASNELVIFIDDDNWPAPDLVYLASKTMSEHPEVGACGGLNHPAFESTPPHWFPQFQQNYAVGPQGGKREDVTSTRGFLWGAGLTVRKSAWQQLTNCGFRFLLTGRSGGNLGAGEDSELCAALMQFGWRLWYDPALRLQHQIARERLDWRYLRRMRRGFGRSSVGLDAYRLSGSWGNPVSLLLLQILLTAFRLLRYGAKSLQAWLLPLEGDADVVDIEWLWGRLVGLIEMRGEYARNLGAVRKLKSAAGSDGVSAFAQNGG